MGKFAKGFFLGTFATLTAVASGVFAFHQNVITPVEEQEERFDENRRAAIRKGRSAHQG